MTPEELIEQAARKIADESGWSWTCSAEYCEHCDCVAGWVDGTIEDGQQALRDVAAPVVALVLKAAAEVARDHSFLMDVGWLLNATKQEVGAEACRSVADAILALSPPE